MQRLLRAEFERLTAGAEILERQAGGLSALRTPDGRIIKLWQRRRGLSSDRVWPYSRRFADNCRRLAQRGFKTPRIEAAYTLSDTGEHALVYPMLRGLPLRKLAEAGSLPLADLAAFYAELHAKGVWFRSIHLGNVLKLETRGFGLIDVSDTRFFRRPLKPAERAHNLGYAWSYRLDQAYFTPEVRARLLQLYLDNARFSEPQAGAFLHRLEHYRRHYAARNQRR